MVLKVEWRIKEQSLTCCESKSLFPKCLHFMEFLDTVISSSTFSGIFLTLALCPLPASPPHTSHLCLAHVYPHFLFYFFLSISLHSVLSPYLHSSLPFHLTCSFYLRHIFLLERKKKKKLKSKTVDLPRCFALSYKIPKSTRFFFLFTFQYQRLAQEFSGSKN